MGKTTVFNESYHILTDTLAMCSVMFQKGIVEANGFCDTIAMKGLAQRVEDEHYTTLKLIRNHSIYTLTERQYLNLVRAYASEYGLNHFRNFTLTGKPEIVSASCTLLDFCYRLGVGKTYAYDQSRIGTLQKEMRIGGFTYFTPKGKMREQAWFDELRSYITVIEIELGLNFLTEKAEQMAALDEFFASVMKARRELQTSQDIENERRKFILSGGSL